ncbi:hypothetical protein BDW72DRAFT_209910 [Aspergillus terricola var. indicus]
MDRATHVIDPDGEVVIVLQNPNAPFAELSGALRNEPMGGKRKKKDKKKKKKGSTSGWRAVHDPSQPIHSPFEEPAPEWPAAEEPVAEPTEEPVEEPVAEPAEESPEEKCFRIQVSAKHLILASSVFKKILTGGWKESITYLQKGSVEITADSCDPEALLIMLRILHCQETVVFFADTWINALDDTIPTTYSRDLILWLWVAWQAEIAALIFQLHETRDQLQSGSKGCGFECSSIMYGALTKQMHQIALLLPMPTASFPGLSYRSLVQEVSSFKSPVWSDPRSYYSGRKHECSYSSFTLLFGMLKDTIEGLDLDSHLQT